MLDEEEIYNRGYRAGHNAGRAEHRKMLDEQVKERRVEEKKVSVRQYVIANLSDTETVLEHGTKITLTSSVGGVVEIGGLPDPRTAEIRAICRALEEAWLHTPTETLEAMCRAVVLDEIPCDQADPMLWLREIRGK